MSNQSPTSHPPNDVEAITYSGTDSDTVNVPDYAAEKSDGKHVSQGWGSDAPDGGAAAWLCVLGAWCTSICSFGWINSSCKSCHPIYKCFTL